MKKYESLRHKAIELRYEGKSLKEIYSELSLPKGTVYEWIKDIPLQRSSKSLDALRDSAKNKSCKKITNEVIDNILSLRSDGQTIYQIRDVLGVSLSSIDRVFKKYNIGKLDLKQINESKWIEEAKQFFVDHSDNPLFMLGIGLYWGEGSKLSNGKGGLELCNSDAGVISSWLKWCYCFLPYRELKFKLNLHDLKLCDQALLFWHKECQIPVEKIKVYNLKRRSKNPQIKIPNGVLYVRVAKGSMEDLIKMTCWFDMLRNTIRNW